MPLALHFALSTPNFLIQEDMLTDVPWRWDVVRSELSTENGYWLPTTAPGLGIEVDEEAGQKASLPTGSDAFDHDSSKGWSDFGLVGIPSGIGVRQPRQKKSLHWSFKGSGSLYLQTTTSIFTS